MFTLLAKCLFSLFLLHFLNRLSQKLQKISLQICGSRNYLSKRLSVCLLISKDEKKLFSWLLVNVWMWIELKISKNILNSPDLMIQWQDFDDNWQPQEFCNILVFFFFLVWLDFQNFRYHFWCSLHLQLKLFQLTERRNNIRKNQFL